MILYDDLSLTIIEVNTLGRKHQLSLIREKLNKNQEEYFQLFTDDQLNNMTNCDLIGELKRINEYDQLCRNDELKNKLKIHQRRRFLQFWQGGATISNHGHILIMVNIINNIIYKYDNNG